MLLINSKTFRWQGRKLTMWLLCLTPIDDSDQPGHRLSLIIVLAVDAVGMKKTWVHGLLAIH